MNPALQASRVARDLLSERGKIKPIAALAAQFSRGRFAAAPGQTGYLAG